MKSFQVYLTEPSVPPARMARAIPERERAVMVASFAPVARRYRRRRRVMMAFWSIGFITIPLSMVFPALYPVGIWTFFVCAAFVVLLNFTLPTLVCPACNNIIVQPQRSVMSPLECNHCGLWLDDADKHV